MTPQKRQVFGLVSTSARLPDPEVSGKDTLILLSLCDFCRSLYGDLPQRDCPGLSPGSLLMANCQPFSAAKLIQFSLTPKIFSTSSNLRLSASTKQYPIFQTLIYPPTTLQPPLKAKHDYGDNHKTGCIMVC